MRDIVRSLIEKKGFKSLLPIQQKFLEWWEKEDRKNNLIVSAPTTSGKTLIAEALIKHNLVKRNDLKEFVVIYISPLKALIDEKYVEFNASIEDLLIEVGVLDIKLQGKKLILVTPELFFECIKNNPQFLRNLPLIIIDEIHLISDKNRGMILDFLLTFLKNVCTDTQFILMSATISYSQELMNWIDAESIEDGTRAVKLSRKVKLVTRDKKGDDIVDLILKEIEEKKSIIVFRGTKAWVHSTVKKISKKYAREVSDTYLKEKLDYGKKTRSDQNIEKYLRSGIGLHHADIRSELKTIVENSFREQKISILVCTTTLGMGVNLPADTVIVSDLNLGRSPLTLMNFYQLAGRAGRLGYSEYGLAYLLVTKKRDEDLWNKLISLPFESDDPINLPSIIISGMVSIGDDLESNPNLEIYLLRIVGTKFFKSWDQIIEHHKSSFSQYYHNEKAKSETKIKGIEIYPGLHQRIEKANEFEKYTRNFGELFENNNIVETDENLKLTIIGDMCLQNYISPILLMLLINWIKQEKEDNLTFFDLLVRTVRLFPDLYVAPDPDNRSLYVSSTINSFRERNKDVFDYLPSKYKVRKSVTTDLTLAAMLLSAFGFQDFEEVCDHFGVMYQTFINAKRRLTSIYESISTILEVFYEDKINSKIVKKYAQQIHYCVSEEKISLVSIPGIGKTRAELITEKFDQIRELSLKKDEKLKEIASIKGVTKKTAKVVLDILENQKEPIKNEKHTTFEYAMNEVLKLLDKKETELLEYKLEFNSNSVNHKKKFARTVCAMTNNEGGYFVYGIDNEGNIIGVDKEKYPIEIFDNIISERIQPKFNNYHFYLGNYKGKDLIIFQIFSKTESEPYYCDKIIYFRRHGRNDPVTYEEYIQLKKE